MVNVKKLRDAIVEKGFTMEKVAKAMGMNRSTLYRRFDNDGKDITIEEADALCKILELTGYEASIIFFNQYVA